MSFHRIAQTRGDRQSLDYAEWISGELPYVDEVEVTRVDWRAVHKVYFDEHLDPFLGDLETYGVELTRQDPLLPLR